MNESIHNENVGNDQRLRHQATNQGLEHLRVSHPEVYKFKLRLDVAAAILFDDFGIKTRPTAKYQIPRTGGRMLVTYPGCRFQKPQTYFKLGFFSAIREHSAAPHPSYFAILTAMDAATVLVCVALHTLYASLTGLVERAKENSAGSSESAAEMKAKVSANKQANQDYMRTIKPLKVTIPPYSAFIARGDLVHAGDSSALTGESVELRVHIHCTSALDSLNNEIYTSNFEELTQSENEEEEESSQSESEYYSSSNGDGESSGEEARLK
jgi:hypothetical protein